MLEGNPFPTAFTSPPAVPIGGQMTTELLGEYKKKHWPSNTRLVDFPFTRGKKR